MKKIFQVSIPSPCMKQWDEMNPSENGRYCGHCKTEVVDFSGWTEKDVADFVLSNKAKVCGRLGTKPIISSKAAVTFSGFSLLTYLSITSVLSLAYVKNSDGKLTTFPTTKFSIETAREHNVQLLHQSDSLIIRGKVIGENAKDVLPGVHIKIKGNSGGAISNAEGLFEIKTPKRDNKHLTLNLTFIGYEGKAIEVLLPKDGSLDVGVITMIPANIMLGEVIIINYRKKT